MSGNERDPAKDFLAGLWRDIAGEPKGSSGAKNGGSSDAVRKPAVDKFVAVSPIAVLAASLAIYAPRIAVAISDSAAVASVAATVHGYRLLAVVAAAVLVLADIARYRGHRWAEMLDSLVRQSTGHQPVKVRVAFPPGLRTLRGARVKMPLGAIIRPKELEKLTSAVKAAIPGRGQWILSVTHQAHRDRLAFKRTAIEVDTRSRRHKALEQVVTDGPLKDAVVTVEERDEDGVEIGYRISFTPTMNAGSKAFQMKVEEALAELAGEHESGRNWHTDWTPSKGHLVMKLLAPLPTRFDHPLQLVDEDLRHLPYATGAASKTMFWDVSTKSNKPHCLIVGPTGGGKTSVIRTLLTEASRRGIPFLGVDPKMIELDGLEGYPGCGAIVYDPLRSAMMVRALHTEMMARNKYVHVKKIEPSELPLLVAVLDEFFILSGKWQRLAKTGDDDTKQTLQQLDPLGAWADLAVLARSAGIRLLLGVQRPDASLFGSSSGNARDNFGTRMSLGNLSQDGALMLWGDAHVGRDVDTSIPGRGMVTAPDGSPEPAQMWWTPNVDRHPNKWGQLSATEKAIIEGLQPVEAPQFVFYSKELRDFVESERALAKRARNSGEVPEPFLLDESDESNAADAIPASAVTAGQTVLIDDNNDNLVPVVVESVNVRRDDAGAVIETVLTIATGGRVKTAVSYDASGVVFLPEPDELVATAA